MKQHTIQLTTEHSLCISCGICRSICPKDCITWEKKNGAYYPEINSKRCVSCGLCVKVCPGLGFVYDQQSDTKTAMVGPVLASYNAWSLDPHLRHVSASGGVISTLVQTLLRAGAYDVAFCVDSYSYDTQLRTVPVTARDLNEFSHSSYPKSRYLSVSHENAVSYIRDNPSHRVIFIGTSCAVRGFLHAARQLRVARKNILAIGLFCDQVFSYHVIPYLSQIENDSQKELTALHFKNKESGGWPGNMKLFFSDGTFSYLDKSHRMHAKEYFKPERCLYCIDKLNICADISVGDNYTEANSSLLGSNSVIIRSEAGATAWTLAGSSLEIHPVHINAVTRAQYLAGRQPNYYYSLIKERQVCHQADIPISLNKGLMREPIPPGYQKKYTELLERLQAGQVYSHSPEKLDAQIETDQTKTHRRAKLQQMFVIRVI